MVNVEYRLAPEYPFPAGIDDGCTVARWVLQHKTLLGKQALIDLIALKNNLDKFWFNEKVKLKQTSVVTETADLVVVNYFFLLIS